MADDFLSWLTTPSQLANGTVNGMPITQTGASPLQGGIQALMQLLTGGMNLANSHDPVTYGNEAARMADPFSQERSFYQPQLRDYMGQNAVNPTQVTAGTNNALSMLQNLLANPQSIRDNPAYKAGLDFGTEAVNRGAGASGMLNSGNRLTALNEFGQNYGMKFYNDIVNQLSGNVSSNINAANLGLTAQGQGYQELANLSGVNSGSPAQAAQDYLWGRGQQAQSTGAGIGGIVNGIGGLASSVLPGIQRLLTGGGTSLGGGGLGGLSPDTVYGQNSGWGQDIYPSGGGGGFPDNWDLMGNYGGGTFNDPTLGGSIDVWDLLGGG